MDIGNVTNVTTSAGEPAATVTAPLVWRARLAHPRDPQRDVRLDGLRQACEHLRRKLARLKKTSGAET